MTDIWLKYYIKFSVSASTKTYSSALTYRHNIGQKSKQKRVLQGYGGKDAEAIEWEPPKLALKPQNCQINRGKVTYPSTSIVVGLLISSQ